MATYNNKHWLLCHIRNSFITTDDTGISEAVMQSDDMPSAYLKNLQRDLDEENKSSTGPSGELLPVDLMVYPGMDEASEDEFDLPGSYEVSCPSGGCFARVGSIPCKRLTLFCILDSYTGRERASSSRQHCHPTKVGKDEPGATKSGASEISEIQQ